MIYKHTRSFAGYLNDKKMWMALYGATFGLFWFRMPPQLPLYYSQVLKEDKLANSYEILIIPFFVYLAFLAAEKWLYKLALENAVIKEVIRLFLVGFAVFGYVVFLTILFIVA